MDWTRADWLVMLIAALVAGSPWIVRYHRWALTAPRLCGADGCHQHADLTGFCSENCAAREQSRVRFDL